MDKSTTTTDMQAVHDSTPTNLTTKNEPKDENATGRRPHESVARQNTSGYQQVCVILAIGVYTFFHGATLLGRTFASAQEHGITGNLVALLLQSLSAYVVVLILSSLFGIVFEPV